MDLNSLKYPHEARDGRDWAGGFFWVALVAALLGLLASQAHADVLLGAPAAVDAGQCGGPDGGFIEGAPAPGCGDWLVTPECGAAGVDAGDGSESCFCHGPCGHQKCFASNLACVLDEDPAPRFAHLDAGVPAPFTGDLLNTAAEQNLLAAAHPDAGAPCAEAAPSDALETALHIALVVVSAGAAVWVHQRIVK